MFTEDYVALDLPTSSVCNLDCKYCLPKGTKILLSNYEEKNIEDINVGDELLSFEEYSSKIFSHRKIIKTKVLSLSSRQSETIEILTNSGLSIRATKDHPFLSARGSNKNSWRELGKFKIGQKIRIYPKINFKTANIEDINYKVGYFISMMMGDGSCNKYLIKNKDDKYYYKIRLSLKDKEGLERVEKYGIDLDMHFYSKKFLKYDKALFSNKKSDYDLIIKLKKENMKTNNSYEYACGYLAGIYDAEGSINKHGLIRISNTDLNIIKEIERCLNIVGNIEYVRETDKKGTKNHSIKYRIRIKNSPKLYFIKFIKCVSPAISRKSNINFYNNKAITSDIIVDIKENNKNEIVYNLETDSHTYIANYFCVHNCYIAKNKTLKDINKKWEKIYKSGTSFEIISESFEKNKLEDISLWGAEPSLGFNKLSHLEEFLDYNKNLNKFSTSTNFTNYKCVEFLLLKLNQYAHSKNKKFEFSLQISIDGPEKINDSNRGSNVYKTIILNFKKLSELIKKLDRVSLSVHTKMTCIMSNFVDFINDKNLLKNFLTIMKEINDDLVNSANESNNFHYINLITLPTLGLPGSYTKEDGKIFAKFLAIEDEVLNEMGPVFRRVSSQYENRLFKMFNIDNMINYRSSNRIFQCSAGTSMKGLDLDGTKHECHGSYWYNYEDYSKNSTDLTDWAEGMRIMEITKNKIDQNLKQSTANYRDEYNNYRLNYLIKSNQLHLEPRLNISYATVKTLANHGQISSIYKNDDWAKVLTSYIVTTSGCWFTNSFECGSIPVTPLSVYRIFGNGAVEFFMNKIQEAYKDVI